MREGVIGIGVDLCAIGRMEKAIEKEHFAQRIFTQEERSYLEKKGAARADSAAAMFAAKEAVAKALGTGFAKGVMPAQIEVTHADGGAPGVRLHKAAKARLEAIGGGEVLLSLSHEKDTAIAFAVIQAKPDTNEDN